MTYQLCVYNYKIARIVAAFNFIYIFPWSFFCKFPFFCSFNPTRGDHGSVRPRKIKTCLFCIFLKKCGAASMTFHEICKYTVPDEKICNFQLNVSRFIKYIQKLSQ